MLRKHALPGRSTGLSTDNTSVNAPNAQAELLNAEALARASEYSVLVLTEGSGAVL